MYVLASRGFVPSFFLLSLPAAAAVTAATGSSRRMIAGTNPDEHLAVGFETVGEC